MSPDRDPGQERRRPRVQADAGQPGRRRGRPDFFVFACERSGSTLLGALLSQHDDVHVLNDAYVLRELNRMWSTAPDWLAGKALARLVGTSAARAFAERSRLPTVATPVTGAQVERFEQRFAAWCRSHHTRRIYLDRIDLEAARARASGPGLRLADLIDHLHRVLAPARGAGARLLGEKTPRHTYLRSWIRRNYPGVKEVVLVRSPVTNVAAVYRRHARGLEDATAIYRSYWHVLGLEESPARTFVRYEDLIAEPERTLARVLAFLGVPDDVDATTFDYDRPGYIGSSIDPERDRALASLLDRDEQRFVADRCRAVCERFYPDLVT